MISVLKNQGFISLFVLTCFLFYGIDGRQDLLLESSFLVNALFSLFQLFRYNERPYSLFRMFFLFNFSFMAVIPFVQWKSLLSFWGAQLIADNTYLYLNLLLLGTQVLFVLIYDRFSYEKEKPVSEEKESLQEWNLFSKVVLFVFLSLICVFTFYVYDFNWFFLIFRGMESNERDFLKFGQSFMLFFDFFIRPIPLVVFIFYWISDKSQILWRILFMILALICLFPTSVPRLQAAALYMPVVFLMFPALVKGNRFNIFFIGALLVVFPFLNQFRYFSLSQKVSFELDFSILLTEHFDAYHNLGVVLDTRLVTYGNQLLGALLFFIPRSLWHNKPLGSGHFVAQQNNFYYDNVSMPYVAEGYLNGGFLIVFFFILLIALFSVVYDNRFWNTCAAVARFKIRYLIMLGMFFFILRGDLMNGIAYSVAISLAIGCVDRIVKILNLYRL